MKDNTVKIIVTMLTLMFATSLYSVDVDSTFTISASELQAIRTATGVEGASPDALIEYYWSHGTRTNRRNDQDPSDYPRDRSFTDTFHLVDKAIDAFEAVVNFNFDQDEYTRKIINIRTYLNDFNWHAYQEAIKDTCAYQDETTRPVVPWENNWWRLSAYNRARELSYNLLLISFTVDMLYYAHDDTNTTAAAQMDSIVTNLREHVNWIHRTFFRYGLPDFSDDWNSVGWNIYNLYGDRDPNIPAPKGMCRDDIENKPTSYLPDISNSVSRFHLICGMGYASILTGLDNMLNHFVKNEFKSTTPLPDQTSYYGFNDYLTTNSGMFVGGLTYQNRLLFLSNLFLTALKRTKGINLYNSNNAWNCDMIPRMVRYTLRRIDPELHHITYGDDWRYNGIDQYGLNRPDMNHSIQIERGLLSFYYNNTDDPISRDNIRWYVGELRSANYGIPPEEAYEHDFFSSFETVMNYCASVHGGPPSVTSGGALPSFIAQGTYSDTESSILREPSSTYNEYKKSHMLVVNHENSFIPYHNNNDTTSYQLYLWGHPAIIEAGYVPYIGDNEHGKEARYWDWYQASFPQNLLLINPDLPMSSDTLNVLTEKDYLEKDWTEVNNFTLKYEDPMNFTWPISWLSSIQETRPYHDGARKRFLIRNKNDLSPNDVEHLNIHFRYMNSISDNFDATPSSINHDNEEFPCNVFRNFYKVSDKYFLILDEAVFESEPDTTNTFRNQMHLLTKIRANVYGRSAVFNLEPVRVDENSIYRYYNQFHQGMYIALGSTIPGPNIYRVSHPDTTLLAWTPYDWENFSTGRTGQMRKLFIEAKSNRRKESFVTFLYPSTGINNATNPVAETIKDAAGYRFIVDGNDKKVFVSLCNASTISYPSTNYGFVTDAKLMLLEADSDLSSLHEMILTQATLLTSTPGDSSPPDTIFISHTSGIDETIASWSSSDLYVTFKSYQYLAPRYKIKRCGVMPSRFFSKTEYGLEEASPIDTTSTSRGTLSNNIITLAYDADYFYVNYSWQDLLINGQLPDGLVIAKGTVPAYQVSNNITFNGAIVLTGNLTIQQSGSLNILEGSQITVNNGAGIHNHGTLTINGGTSRSIGIGNENQTWAGITTYQNGLLNINQAIISNAVTGIRIRGNATVTNSKIKGCNKGIFVEVATPFVINGNLITENTYGIDISNSFTTGNLGFIEENQITQNDYGVKCFNSNPYIVLNQICYNTQGGLLLSHYSEPILKNNAICFSGVTGTAVPEIHLQDHAYPVMDNYYNDINIDGDGYSLYYMQPSSRLRHLDARRNYWGLTDENLIRESIYPSRWDVEFRPYCLEPNIDFFYAWPLAFNIASQAELSGDLLMAKQLYADIISTNPQSVEAIQSLGRLNSIYAGAPAQFGELHSIYDSYFASCSDSIYVDLASGKRVMLYRFDRLYQQALGYYEERLTTCSTEIDSLYCLLDIAYTVEEMLNDNQGKSALEVNYSKCGLQISSLSEVRQTIDHLWEQIMANTVLPSEVMVPVPHKLDITNYPNPFNPSTTISFAVPERGNVKLSIYNIKGQKVRELLNEHMGRGFHKVIWDGKDRNQRNVSSGVYFVRLQANGQTAARKIMLMK